MSHGGSDEIKVTILILGSQSQLGKAIIEELSLRKIKYLATNSTELDITNRTSVQAIFEHTNPTIVINCSAFTNVDKAEIERIAAHRVNVDGARIVAEECKKINAILVHISTDYVFSGLNDQPWEINSIREPLNYYGKTKADSEDVITKTYPERSYIFRTSGLYGSHKSNVVTYFVSVALNKGGNALGADNQFCQPTSTYDLSKRILDCLYLAIPYGIYHATSSGAVSWHSFARKIFELCDSDPDRVQAVKLESFKREAKRPLYSVLSESCWNTVGMPLMPTWENSLEREIRNNWPRIVEGSLNGF
jgi:dTDP-4-dehydrorhamnose reductase